MDWFTIFSFGFVSGIGLAFLIYKFAYYFVWHNFKVNGRKRNLKTIRCKRCHNYFYRLKWEKTKLCCNCICLRIEKRILK
jgi:hypothetical protein